MPPGITGTNSVYSVISIQPAISATLDYVHRRRTNQERGREPILMK
ncbi:hypothetical protein IMZ48_14890 [Candidatus Bathyarchaeota archaeon]|nr:hypothetical protein [Candidatus Bathyarchaeota archaeon]